MKKEWVKPEMKVITDTKIILECLYEVYQMDGIAIAADQRIEKTMVYQKMAYRLNRKLCRMIRVLSRGKDKIFKLDLRYYVSYVPRECGNSAHEFQQAYLMRKIWLDEEKHSRLSLY